LPAVRLLEVLQRSAAYLQERGVESPRLQAELILAHFLHLPRLQLYLEFEREMQESELSGAREAVRRRGRREPLQLILGSTSFCGLEIQVTRDVLIPRAETELLAEAAWVWVKEHPAAPGRRVRVLDWGTGSGCLAIAIAVHAPEAEVFGIDASSAALELARRNAARHGCERITWVESDGCASLPVKVFDLVVSNPPYIPTEEIATLAPEVRDYDPRPALDGGPDGLAYFRRLALELPGCLSPNGAILLEFGDGQAMAVSAILRSQGWNRVEIRRDLTGHERFVLARRGEGSDPRTSRLSARV
jgi:release factor glutamine methyltransferase